MTNNELLKADMLDILFEHRNKNYGAYALRKNYNERLGKALGISLALVLSSLVFLFFSNRDKNNSGPIVNKDGVVISQVEIPEKIPEPEVQRPQTNEVQQVNSVNNIVIADVTDMNEQSEIREAAIGTQDVVGDPPLDPNTVINDPQPQPQSQPQSQPEPEPLPKPSYPPSFPGGTSAWTSYLQKFLRTPDELEAGQRIEVLVKFWVETDGSVSRFEVVKSGGNAFDKEVLRVMKKMPKWEAAMQNGEKIAVSFTQPVIFVGQEE